MQNNVLLTIIVPIYNVEKYLAKCLDSLVYQSVMNHHVVLVNDGTPDSSGEIAKEYTKKYPTLFTYVEQENQGLGAARNTGLNYVQTKYVTFLDSDDWLLPRSVEKIAKTISESSEEPDIGFTQPIVFNMATQGFQSWRDTVFLSDLFNQFGAVLSPREIPALYATEASVCRCVFRTKMLLDCNFAFPVGVKWEDVFPHFFLLHHSARCILIPDAGFCYRINSGNQITSLNSSARLDIVPVFSKTFLYALENQWTKEEIARIFEMMMSFISWFLKATSRKHSKALLIGLHKLCVAIPDECYEAYFQLINPPRKTRYLLKALRSRVGYRFLAGRKLSELKRLYNRIRQLIRR